MITEQEILERAFIIADLTTEQVEDVCLAGTYLWGFPKERSDIDVIMYVHKVNIPIALRGVIKGKMLSIKIQHISERGGLFANRFVLPTKSLLTQQFYNKQNHQIEDYLKFRNRKIQYKDEFKGG